MEQNLKSEASYALKVHEFAFRDFQDAFEWYESKKVGLGQQFVGAIESKLQQIAVHPEYFTKIHKKFRQANVDGFPYVIVFEFYPKRKLVHIASFFHVKRSPHGKFRKEM